MMMMRYGPTNMKTTWVFQDANSWKLIYGYPWLPTARRMSTTAGGSANGNCDQFQRSPVARLISMVGCPSLEDGEGLPTRSGSLEFLGVTMTSTSRFITVNHRIIASLKGFKFIVKNYSAYLSITHCWLWSPFWSIMTTTLLEIHRKTLPESGIPDTLRKRVTLTWEARE